MGHKSDQLKKISTIYFLAVQSDYLIHHPDKLKSTNADEDSFSAT